MQLKEHMDGSYELTFTSIEKGLIAIVCNRYGELELRVLERAFGAGLTILELTLDIRSERNGVEGKTKGVGGS